jgi:hypothetical protein
MGHGLFWKKLCEGKIFLRKTRSKELENLNAFNPGKDENDRMKMKKE